MDITKEAINRRFITCINYLLEADDEINKSTLAQGLGISKSKFSEILNNRMNAGIDTVGIFCMKYKFNLNWIMTGSGSPQIKNDEFVSEKIPHTINSKSESNCSVTKSILLTNDQVRNHFTTALKSKLYKKIDICFTGTFDFFIQGNGDSMINRKNPVRSIRNNDLVACKIWKSTSHIRWGEVYALSTKDGLVIKKIMPSENKDFVMCISFNEEEGYLPYELSVNEIYDWAIVVGTTRITNW